MENFISATSICAGAWTIFYKGTFIPGKEKERLSFFHRIAGRSNSLINNLRVFHNFGGQIEAGTDGQGLRKMRHLLIDIKLRKRQVEYVYLKLWVKLPFEPTLEI